MRTVKGTFQLDITTSKAPDHILQEITKALHQSKIEYTAEGFVFHCIGKVNVKGKGDEPVTSYHYFIITLLLSLLLYLLLYFDGIIDTKLSLILSYAMLLEYKDYMAYISKKLMGVFGYSVLFPFI